MNMTNMNADLPVPAVPRSKAWPPANDPLFHAVSSPMVCTLAFLHIERNKAG